MVAHTVTRFEREGLTKQVRHQLSKAVSRIENHEQAPTVNLAKAFADALGVSLTRSPGGYSPTSGPPT